MFSPVANKPDLDPEWGPIDLIEEDRAAAEAEALCSTGDGMLRD